MILNEKIVKDLKIITERFELQWEGNLFLMLKLRWLLSTETSFWLRKKRKKKTKKRQFEKIKEERKNIQQ